MSFFAIIVLLGGGFILMFRKPLVEQLSPRPDNVSNGMLADCPPTSNCVSSQAPPDDSHYVEPLAAPADDVDAIRTQLEAVINEMPRMQIIRSEGNYLYAEFRSDFWGFIDDFEAVIDADAGVIHVRSAARLGADDMGVNRDRVEDIRDRLTAATTTN